MSELLLFNVPATGTRQSKAKPPDLVINRINRELARRRYYLHKRLKDFTEFTLNAADRTIDAPYSCYEAIPVGRRYYVGQLICLGYLVQYKIFSEEELEEMRKDPPEA